MVKYIFFMIFMISLCFLGNYFWVNQFVYFVLFCYFYSIWILPSFFQVLVISWGVIVFPFL